MSNLLPIGVDEATGQQKVLDPGIDVIYVGSNDFVSSSYSGGDISIGTSNDGAFNDVDATNAKITFTVNIPGNYSVSFSFSNNFMGTLGLSCNSETAFRLTDGTNNGDPITVGGFMPGVTLFSGGVSSHVRLVSVFNFLTTGSKTVKLQKRNTTSSSVSSRSVYANSTSAISMSALRISD